MPAGHQQIHQSHHERHAAIGDPHAPHGQRQSGRANTIRCSRAAAWTSTKCASTAPAMKCAPSTGTSRRAPAGPSSRNSPRSANSPSCCWWTSAPRAISVPPRLSKRDLAAELASVLAFSAIRNSDKVGLLLYTDRVERYLPPKKGRRHVLRVVRDILYHTPEGRGTDSVKALDVANHVLHRRAIVFLISDFQSPGEPERARARTAPRHAPDQPPPRPDRRAGRGSARERTAQRRRARPRRRRKRRNHRARHRRARRAQAFQRTVAIERARGAW